MSSFHRTETPSALIKISMRHSVIILLIFMGISCQQYSSDALAGTWKAVHVVEENDTLDLDLSNVKLTFDAKHFRYRHTLRDSMSGTFDLTRGLINLYVQNPEKDTIIIQLSELTDEDLVLRMNHEGKERFVTMHK